VCFGAVRLVHSWNMANPIAIENSVKPIPPTHVSHKAAAPRTMAVIMRVCRLDIETFRRTGLRHTSAFSVVLIFLNRFRLPPPWSKGIRLLLQSRSARRVLQRGQIDARVAEKPHRLHQDRKGGNPA